MKLFTFLLVTFFVTFSIVKAEPLTCYECEGEQCDNLNDSLLKYCGPDDEPNTTEPNATVTNEPNTDETSDGETTDNSSTTESNTPTPTTDSNDSTDSSSTTVESETSTTTESETSTTTDSNTSTDSNDSTDSSSTTVGSETSTTTESETSTTTESETSTTTESETSTTTDSNTSTDSNHSTDSSSSTVESDSSTNTPETTTTTTESNDSTDFSSTTIQSTTTNTDTEGSDQDSFVEPQNSFALSKNIKSSPTALAAARLIRNYRSIGRYERAVNDRYACYTINIPNEANGTKVKRGCINYSATQGACQAIKDKLTIPETFSDNCKACLMPKCNGSGSLKISLLAILFVAIAKFLI